MPSPIAHISAGYVLYAFSHRNLTATVTSVTGKRFIFFAICVFFSMLPDIDAVPGFLTGDMGKYHNQWTHSIAWALGISALCAFVMYWWNKKGFWGWFILFSTCYGIHVLMGFFTYGRGCRLLWPVSYERFKPSQTFLAVCIGLTAYFQATTSGPLLKKYHSVRC